MSKYNNVNGLKFTKLKVGDIVVLPKNLEAKYTFNEKLKKWWYRHFTKADAWYEINLIHKIAGVPLKITRIEIEPPSEYLQDDYGRVYTDLIIRNKISNENIEFYFETCEKKIDELIKLTDVELRDYQINNILR